MKQIALVGEDPNDTEAVANLLSQKHRKECRFYTLNKRIKRGVINSKGKLKKIISAELKSRKRPHFILFIRDSDAPKSDRKKMQDRQTWFDDLNKYFGGGHLFLLNIQMLEALILADIESFNRLFNTKIKHSGDPSSQNDPKHFLISKTYKAKRRFSESQNPETFAHLDFDIVVKNCKYFGVFSKKLAARLQ